jgi:hypothetical protein
MANARDIKLTDNDLEFQQGDFLITNSDQQHIEDIVEAFQGSYKEFPLLGVGIRQYINSAGAQDEVQSLVQLQLESDGYTVNSVILGDQGNIYIDAERI